MLEFRIANLTDLHEATETTPIILGMATDMTGA
jgi:hypothetical protein